ncbi:MAG: ABC transporter ATP-binding protein [Woeseiaceae bacterium]|nr:ABC transporter ATP-binding protein [Woeseiaceae bacterium]
MSQAILEVDSLTIAYDGKPVVDGLTFEVAPAEAVGLVGESGSGKTQTALALMGLLPATAHVRGSATLGGEKLLGRAEAELDALRARRIAMVFQDPSLALNPYLRIGKQLRLILERHGIADGATATRRALDALASVGLPDPDRQARAFPHQLSGGMRQRVMIAAALIGEPDLLIADEPTTALDVTVQAQILALLEEVRKQTALLLITHDLGVVAGHCERMLVLEHGRLVESGPTERVFAAPAHAHTEALIAAHPHLDKAPALSRPAAEELLTLDGIRVSYRAHGSRLKAVNGVELALKKGETVAIVGESGSGKSSLVRAVLGLVPADAGRLCFLGEELSHEVSARETATRRELQMVFQDPLGSLNPQMRVASIVAEPLDVHEPGLSGTDRRRKVVNRLEQVGLDASFVERFPHELSGGQAQRVAIARALVLAPSVLVCDEALAALDGSVREQVLNVLKDVQANTGLAILFISHDLGVVRTLCHRVLVMYLGRIVELADNDVLFSSPLHPYTRALLDAVPVADPTAERPPVLGGEVPSPLSPPAGCAFHPRCPQAVEDCRQHAPGLRRVGATDVACLRASEYLAKA